VVCGAREHEHEARAVDDVMLGAGILAGTGVYAARDFAVGEEVVTYRLQPLDEADYLALPAGEGLFVHSFGGRRYLYPVPARFVNHSDDPSCIQDFDRCCDIALRPISKNESITIDATHETARELDTFLDAHREALEKRSVRLLGELVDSDATLWLRGRAVSGRDAVVAALLSSKHTAVVDVEWLVGTGRWEALCAADTETCDGPLHLTMLLKVVAGNWQMIYQHTG
jgi:hypothetical protein